MSQALPLGMTLESFTKQSKLFEFLDATGRQRMMDLAQRQQFPQGTRVVTEGEAGDSFFVILKGTVTVVVDDLGTEKQVATLGPGSFFGEIAVITNQPRSASVTAASALEVLRFDKVPVLDVLKGYPKVRELLARMGVRRSEDTLEKMMVMDDVTPNPDGDG
jgi:CRP-like cAMP-binding protein